MRIEATLDIPCLLVFVAACGSGSSPSGSTSVTSGSSAASGGSTQMVTGSGTSGGLSSGTFAASSGTMSGSAVGTTSGDTTGGSGTASGSTSGSGATATSGTSSQGGPDASTYDADFPPTVDSGTPMPLGDQTLPRKLYIENHCTYTIWNFALPQSTFPGSVPLQSDPGQAFVVGWPDNWSGRIWGRTKCTGTGGNLKCAQGNGPDTLAEFTLTAGMASDWYDISLVDGFSIPTGILQLTEPFTLSPGWVPGMFNAAGTFVVGTKLGPDSQCGSPVCAVDLLPDCPASQVRKGPDGTIASCENGDNGAGQIAGYFKAGCPTSYSWPFDDPWSLFTCADYRQNNGVGSKDYKVIYCPEQGSTPGFPPYPLNQ
jgi:hypothetical protein